MKRPRQFSFGAYIIHDRAKHIPAWTVGALAKQVRAKVGEAYCDHGDSVEAGWEKAKKAGVRIAKIEVRIIR